MKFNGAKLREIREARGLSQDELARQARVAIGSIKNWEKGATKPRDDEALNRLSRILGVHSLVFFDLAGQIFDQQEAPDGDPAA